MQSRGKVSVPHYKVEEQPSKKPKKSFQNGKSDDKGAVAVVKTVPQLGCVSQGSEPSALPNSVKYRGNPRWKVLGSIRQVRFTQSTLREANIRENKGPSLEKIQVKIPYQRSPCAKKFEYRSQEETERQMRCGRGMAWSLARHICKLKEKDKATSYSPTDKWIMRPREFVVDSGASMHLVSKTDLNSVELETMRISKNPTTVMTANGGVCKQEKKPLFLSKN